MNILLLSNDQILIDTIKKTSAFENQLKIENAVNDPLDIMSAVCDTSPSLLIVDDDYLKPNTAKILKSIKQLYPKLATIFFTSDSTLALGREILPIGIQFYSIKPITENEISELIKSFNKIVN